MVLWFLQRTKFLFRVYKKNCWLLSKIFKYTLEKKFQYTPNFLLDFLFGPMKEKIIIIIITLKRTRSSGSLEIQANETNTIEIRHNKYPFLEEGNQVYFLFLPFQFGCWGRWNQQVERIGWEIWMMIYDDSFHNDQNPRSYLIFSILHNQTPNIQFQSFTIKLPTYKIPIPHSSLQWNFLMPRNTDKYSCFINFTIQDHPSIHPSIHPFIHPSIHPSIRNLFLLVTSIGCLI